MPFNIEAIKKTDADELIEISFSNEDLANQNNLTELKNSLLRFKKVKFKLSEPNPSIQIVINFINFAAHFLTNATNLTVFDISDHNNCFNPISNISSAANRGRGRTNKSGRGLQFQKSPNEKIDDFFIFLIQKPRLQFINLSHTYLFSNKQTNSSSKFFKHICWQRSINKTYDLTNTHQKGECFTLNELYNLVEKDKEGKAPIYSILISYHELPEVLQEKLELADSVNLMDISHHIIDTYRTDCFNQKIANIQTTNPSTIKFEEPLTTLSNEETQQLANVLGISYSKARFFTLPSCNFSNLVSTIKDHKSLEVLDVTNLGEQNNVLINLTEIVNKNTKLRIIKFDYRLALTSQFENFINCLNQSQFKLINFNPDESSDQLPYIELTDKDNLLKNPECLLKLMKAIKNYPGFLKNIQIVINLNALSPDLCDKLVKKELAPKVGIDYDTKELVQLAKSLLIKRSYLPNYIIITPCYDTQPQVIETIIAFCEEKIKELASQQIYKESISEEDIAEKQSILEIEFTTGDPSTSSTSDNIETSLTTDTEIQQKTEENISADQTNSIDQVLPPPTENQSNTIILDDTQPQTMEAIISSYETEKLTLEQKEEEYTTEESSETNLITSDNNNNLPTNTTTHFQDQTYIPKFPEQQVLPTNPAVQNEEITPPQPTNTISEQDEAFLQQLRQNPSFIELMNRIPAITDRIRAERSWQDMHKNQNKLAALQEIQTKINASKPVEEIYQYIIENRNIIESSTRSDTEFTFFPRGTVDSAIPIQEIICLFEENFPELAKNTNLNFVLIEP